MHNAYITKRENTMSIRSILATQGYRLEQIINWEDEGTDIPLRLQISRHGQTKLQFATFTNGVLTIDPPRY